MSDIQCDMEHDLRDYCTSCAALGLEVPGTRRLVGVSPGVYVGMMCDRHWRLYNAPDWATLQLDALRAAVHMVRNPLPDGTYNTTVEEIVSLFADLDTHMAAGNAPPAAWCHEVQIRVHYDVRRGRGLREEAAYLGTVVVR